MRNNRIIVSDKHLNFIHLAVTELDYWQLRASSQVPLLIFMQAS